MDEELNNIPVKLSGKDLKDLSPEELEKLLESAGVEVQDNDPISEERQELLPQIINEPTSNKKSTVTANKATAKKAVDVDSESSSGSTDRFVQSAIKSQCEIVLLHTSLGASRNSYFDSIRLRHFLDIKGVAYYCLDINKEASWGRGLLDDEYIEKWAEEGLLLRETTGNIMIPQLLMDGVSVGTYVDVQDLEEDEDFDYCRSEAQCPGCLHPRISGEPKCSGCGAKYQTLVAEVAIKRSSLMIVKQGVPINMRQQRIGSSVMPTDYDQSTMNNSIEFD